MIKNKGLVFSREGYESKLDEKNKKGLKESMQPFYNRIKVLSKECKERINDKINK